MITTKLSQSKLNLKISKQTKSDSTFPGNGMWSTFALALSPVIPVSKYNICPSLHSMDFNYYIFLNVNSLFPSIVFWWIALFWHPFVLSLDRCLLLVRCLEKKFFFQVSTVKADNVPSPWLSPETSKSLTYNRLFWQSWSETLKRILEKIWLLFVVCWYLE